MEYIYLICLLFALAMLFCLKIFDVRNSVYQFITLLIIVISSAGFYFVSVSTTLEEAILANSISYIGGLFLPVFYLLMVLEICHIELPKLPGILAILFQCFLFGLVCTIGKSDIYYKSVDIVVKNGFTILDKVYGPLHFLYPLSMYCYLFIAFAVAIYSLVKNKSVNRRGVLAMVIFGAFAVCTYAVKSIMHLDFEIIPIGYVVLILGAFIPVYDSNLFTVYENTEIVNEQLDRIGFLTFNTKGIYKGCNNYMTAIFPELSEYRIGQKIENCSPELQALIGQITPLENLYKNTEHGKHIHTNLEGFLLNEKYYAGMVHVVTNSLGSLKGYTIELRDETEHYKTLALKEHYNEELSKEVDEKTERIRSIQEKIILGMAQMVESRDLSTGGHIKRTSDVVRIFAGKLFQSEDIPEIDQRFMDLIVRSAPMHDIGKIGVDDAVLRKQGRYTEEEYNEMKKHSEIGFRMVREILSDVEEPDFVSVAENIAHYHHEKIDGTGYPCGLKDKEIPLEARIMALADVFDALVSKRCYKDAFSYDKAFSIIQSDAGTHFDPRLAEVFISCRPELEAYYNSSAE